MKWSEARALRTEEQAIKGLASMKQYRYEHSSKDQRKLSYDGVIYGKKKMYIEVKERNPQYAELIRKQGFILEKSKVDHIRQLMGANDVLVLIFVLGLTAYVFTPKPTTAVVEDWHMKASQLFSRKGEMKTEDVLVFPMKDCILRYQIEGGTDEE